MIFVCLGAILLFVSVNFIKVDSLRRAWPGLARNFRAGLVCYCYSCFSRAKAGAPTSTASNKTSAEVYFAASRDSRSFFLQSVLILSLCFSATAQAESLEVLASSPEWLALGHYHKTTFGYKSYVYSGDFFLSNAGRHDNVGELRETIKRFESKDIQAICRFPARFNYLSKHFPDLKNISVDCAEFSEWFFNINPQSLTLIFPASFINNPASAFGHTLLRINQPGQDENSALIAYSANFSAQTAGENAIAYALKGVFGGFPGRFAVAPYYKLVKKYSDLESRDIYEYDLNFNQAETHQLVRHLWELRNTDFTYYYFDENCSYHLLGLFDVMRPELKLREEFNAWAIPGDTLKAILNREIVTKKIFRPSLISKFNARVAATTKNSVELAAKVIDREITPEEVSDAPALELSYDYLEYLAFRKGVEDRAYSLRLLKQRSQSKEAALNPLPEASFPEEAHASQRIKLQSGISDSEVFTQLTYRGSYHYLDDPLPGFPAGSGIELVEGVLRFYDEAAYLQKLKIINIASLTPQNKFLQPLSWKLSTGFVRGDTKEQENKLYSRNYLLAGVSNFFNKHDIWYLLPGAILNLNSRFDDNYSLGPAFNTGVLIELENNFNFRQDLLISRHLAGEMHSEVSFETALDYSLTDSAVLELSFLREKTYEDYDSEGMISLKYYY